MSLEHPSIRVTVIRPGLPPIQAGPLDSPVGEPTQVPLIDIHEGPEGLVLEADLPGVKREDVVIQLDHNVLTLLAKSTLSYPEGSRLLHEEFPSVGYLRSFILSDEVDRDAITAEMNRGVLRLTLPKAARAKPRRIEIKSS